MPNYAEYRDEALGLYNEAKELLAQDDISAEDEERAERLINEANDLKAQAMRWDNLTDAMREIEARKMESERQEMEQKHGTQIKYWGQFLDLVHASGETGRPHDLIKHLAFHDKEEVAAERNLSDRKALSGDVGSSGGFLIPEEFQAQLYSVMAENTIVRQRATVIPMRRRQITLPVVRQSGTAAGSPHWFGGMTFYWQGEGSQKTETQPAFDQAVLTANKMIGYTVASDELLDDAAISLEAFLSGPLGFAGGVAWMEDYAFLRGDGVGKPRGIVGAPATVSATRAGAGAIAYTDLVGMLEAFLPSGNGLWIITHSALSNLLLMEGPSGNPSFLWGPNSAVAGQPPTLLGRPYVTTEKLPGVGSAGDILLVDLSYYVIGDRQATTVESTQFDRWRNDETSWRVVHRVDGRPWLDTPLTLADGTTQVSPFVQLAA